MGLFRRLALTTALATFVLIVAGGFVRFSGSGLGCPEWPTCGGQLIPPPTFQALVEFSHRFIAALVGLLVVLTLVYAWTQFRSRRWLIWPSALAVAVLTVEIGLGGLTVDLELQPVMITTHLALAVLVYTLAIITASAARWESDQDRQLRVDNFAALALLTAALSFAMILVGSFVSVSSAAYACSGWPLCGNGFQFPVDWADDLNLLHRLITVLVGICYILIIGQVRRARPAERELHGQLYWGLVFYVAQFVVGAALVLSQIQAGAPVVHLALGSAFYGTLVALTFLACFPKRVEVTTIETIGSSTDLTITATLGQRITAYVNLTKPRIILLLLITTLLGMVIAARSLPSFWLILVTMVGGAFAAGGANAINCYLDRDIDQLMHRTQNRALPRGKVPPKHALIEGLILGVLSFIILTLFANLLTAVLALGGLLFYVLIYTGILKRSTPQNIVIGGAAGAIPPMVGWTAVTGHLDLLALYMFAVIFFWTPPHFWALSLLTSQDYARANVPMLPLIAGEGETRRQIFLYSILLVAVTLLLFSGRTMGLIYLVAALALGAGLLYYAVQLLRDGSRQRASQLFHYSNLYLALIFLAMAVDRIIPTLGMP